MIQVGFASAAEGRLDKPSGASGADKGRMVDAPPSAAADRLNPPAHIDPDGGREALLAMEPELRTLRSVVAACRIFAQSPDPVDPAALALLASGGAEASERLLVAWRIALGARPP